MSPATETSPSPSAAPSLSAGAFSYHEWGDGRRIRPMIGSKSWIEKVHG